MSFSMILIFSTYFSMLDEVWGWYIVFNSTLKQLTDQPDENVMYLRAKIRVVVTCVISAVSLADYRCGSCYSLDAGERRGGECPDR